MNALTPAAFVADVAGGRALVLGPGIPDAAPQLVREGIARRRLVVTGQPCPCGATLTLPSRQQRRAAQRRGEVLHIAIRHADDCPAGDEILLPALARWTAR
jgi:hypothetical protein